MSKNKKLMWDCETSDKIISNTDYTQGNVYRYNLNEQPVPKDVIGKPSLSTSSEVDILKAMFPEAVIEELEPKKDKLKK